MSRKKINFMILTVILLLLIAWANSRIGHSQKQKETYRVSVIVDDSFNDRWSALREGLEQSAAEKNILLNYVYTSEFKNTDEQLELMEREIEGGAQGIIVQFISSEVDAERLKKITQRAKILLLHAGINEEPGTVQYSEVGTDDYAVGVALAGQVIADFGRELEEKQIGVLCDYQDLISSKECLNGLKETLEKNNCSISWMNNPDSKEQPDYKNLDVLVALGNCETEEAVDYLVAKKAEGKLFTLYGRGYSEKAVYYLDKGVVCAMAVPNEFNIGYLSMQLLDEMVVKGNVYNDLNVGFTIVNQSNLYDEANQKVLFPIVQ